MKLFKKSTIKKALLTCFMVFATTLCAALGVSMFQPTAAKAEEAISNTTYQTDGASVRVFQLNDGTYEDTAHKGIRFHVEMGVGYTYDGKTILTAEKHERGSYIITEGFKTYTLVLPTRLLKGDLTVDSDKVMKIDTTEYWYDDAVGNWESVGYIHSVPEKWYTDNFSYRGVICTVAENGTETVVAQTSVEERSLTGVAKQAYNDPDLDFGTRTEEARGLIKEFIPTYSITYNVNDVETTEEVMWGDTPQNVPTEGVKGAWYDKKNSEEVNVTETMDWTMDRTLELHTTSSEEFVLTGVASETKFEVDSTTYHGVKVFATLHREAFASKTKMDVHAVNVEHVRGGEVLCDGIELQGVWTFEETNSLGESQMRLFFALDTSTLQSGDEIVIKGDSVFYANNVMYKLTEDYTIDYTKQGEVEDYGMYLGDLYNSDILTITNCSEDPTGNNGKPTEFTIRVEFYEDVMINGEFTFEFGTNEDGSAIEATEEYPYPVFIKCGKDKHLVPIAGGRYYWNEGDHKLLELIGTGDYANKVYGWHNGDELIAAPGTVVKQNGGYYIFKDEMYGYYLAKNDEVDQWGYALGDWVVGTEKAQYTTAEFATRGEMVDIEDNNEADKELRINTVNHWFPDNVDKVNALTIEKMSDTAPFGVYHTSADGTVAPIKKVRYHGIANTQDGGYFQILGFCGLMDAKVGDIVTIAAGTRFWLGVNYYTVTDEITYYYNGAYWLQNFDTNTIQSLTANSFNFKSHNNTVDGAVEVQLQLNGALEGMPTTDKTWTQLTIGQGNATLKGNAAASVWYYRWDENSIFLVVKGFIGQNKFADELVIEGNTTLWFNEVGYQLPEEDLKFLYTGYSKFYNTTPDSFSEKHEWMLNTGVNVNVSNADVGTIVNHIETWCNNEEVRFHLDAGSNQILGTGYSGVAAINVNKPAIYNGTEVIDAQYYGDSDIIAVVGAYGTKDGDYVIIPADSVWWTKNGGTVTITDEIIATYVNGAWVKGDYRASVNINAPTATVSGVENIAKGQTYTITVAPTGSNIVSTVVINGTTYNATANGQYTFTAQATNEITVNTLVGYEVDFVVPTGAVVDGGAIGNGGIKAVAEGGWLTFSVAASEGYKLLGVSGAASNGDGTYTVSNVTSDTTVTVSVEKLYKVTYSGENASVTANVANGAWVDNGATVTFTISVDDGYTLINVENATKVDATTYTATVNGADLAVTASALKNDAFVDITDRIQIEDRAWGAHTGEVYVGFLDTGMTYTDANGSQNHYLNTIAAVNTAWHADTTAPITANGGVDIMEYIYVNGVSARKLITDNYKGAQSKNSCDCWLSNPAAYPVYVETTNGSGIMMRLATAVFGTEFTITVKAGFRITNEAGSLVAVTKDVDFNYANATITKEVITSQYTVEFADVTGASISVTANGNAVSSGATVAEGTEISVNVTPTTGYNLTSVKINGVEQGTGGTYTFTALKNTTIEIATAIKTYTVAASVSGGVTATPASKTVNHGSSVTFTLNVPANAIIKVGNTTIYTNTSNSEATYSYEVKNVTSAQTITFTTWYTVTVTNTNNAKLTGLSNNMEVQAGVACQFTVADVTASLIQQTGCTVNSVKLNGGTFSDDGSTTKNGAGTYTATFTSKPTVTIEATQTKYEIGGGNNPCIVEGTMITLADGTQKAVEDLQVGDMLLVFNHYTGEYDARPLAINAHADEEAKLYNILNVNFSNGAQWRIAGTHGIFDMTLNEYVMISLENIDEYVGHKFYYTDGVTGEAVTLTNYFVTEEVVKIYSPATVEFANYFANGLLNAPPLPDTYTAGQMNYFDFDENMMYMNVQEDIEKYGLYTYEDFADYISEDVFNAFPFKYFKISVEKGIMTWDDIMAVINMLWAE